MSNIEVLPGRISPQRLMAPGNLIDLAGGSAEPLNPPLHFIPPPEARLCALGSLLEMNTAGHEGLHTIAAINLGVPIEKIVLSPSGDILGATFIGRTSPDKLQKIALAGTMHTLIGGPAQGYGSDVAKARMINLIQGGDPNSSLFYERLEAQRIVNQTPEKVQEKFFQILAYLEPVTKP